MNELVKSINKNGLKSLALSQCMDQMVHFLSLAPAVQLDMPQWFRKLSGPWSFEC